MITKNVVIGLINILENGIIQIRTDTIILEDDVELSRSYHRSLLEPGVDISNQHEKIKSIAAIFWTPEIIEKRREFIERNNFLATNGKTPF